MSASSPARVVLVPGVLALLPEYAGLEDPVAALRAACVSAVRWLCDDGAAFEAVEVVADAQGERVARALLAAIGASASSPASAGPAAGGAAYLVVGNGSARRSDQAPGHLDGRAADFDAALGAALRGPDLRALAAVDRSLAQELWASVDGIARLADLLTPGHRAEVDYDDAPFGVQYWVVRWARGPGRAGAPPGVARR